jgi:hypothetical protein
LLCVNWLDRDLFGCKLVSHERSNLTSFATQNKKMEWK